MAKILTLVFLFLLVWFCSVAHAETLTTPDELIGWHELPEVTDLSTGYLNDSGLGIARVFLLEIKSGEVSEIFVDTDTYSVEVYISEPDSVTTSITINTTNYTGATVSDTHSFYHFKAGPLSTPIYVLVGQPPLTWGVHSQGVVAKTYEEVDLIINPAASLPASFALGWDVYYDGYLEPPMQFHITSDGPITVRYEVLPMDEIHERRDNSIADFALSLLAKVPYVGKPLALSIEAIGTVMSAFIALVFFVITGWAIMFLLFETFVCAHAISVMKAAGGGMAGILGVFTVIASDNFIMIGFVVDLFTKMFSLLIDLVKALRDMSPI
jgi:hypothetical protein